MKDELMSAMSPLAYLGGLVYIPLAKKMYVGRARCHSCEAWVSMESERCPECGWSIASNKEMWSDPEKATSPAVEAREDPAFILFGLLVLIYAVLTVVLLPFVLGLAVILGASAVYSIMRIRNALANPID